MWNPTLIDLQTQLAESPSTLFLVSFASTVRPRLDQLSLPAWQSHSSRDSQSLSRTRPPVGTLAADTTHRTRWPTRSSSCTDTASSSTWHCSRTHHRISDHTWGASCFRYKIQIRYTRFPDSLDGNRIDDATHFEAALFELHYGCVVDAGSLREDENRWIVGIRNVLLQPFGNQMAILGLASFEPNVRRSSGQSSLENAQEATMSLANLQSDADPR